MMKLRSREIYKDSSVTIIAVESIGFSLSKTTFGIHLSGTIEPIAVIVSSPDGTYALGMDGQALDPDQLRRDLADTRAQMK